MTSYIIRRLFLMIPTLFGITLVVFLILKISPGDPLVLQLQQGGAAGESTVQPEAFALQRRQWNLNKPLFLNFRYFKDYSRTAHLSAYFRGLSDEILLTLLQKYAEQESTLTRDEQERLSFLRNLGIENFNYRIKDPGLREELPKIINLTAIRILIQNLEEYIVTDLINLLKSSNDTTLKIGAIRCVITATYGDPFVYTYSKEPNDDETEAIVTTWNTWWNRVKSKFEPLPPDRMAFLDSTLRELTAANSRSAMMEAIKQFSKSDAPYFITKLQSQTSVQEKVIASLALKSWHGKPLRADVKVTDSEKIVVEVAENWMAYYEVKKDRYHPSFMSKLGYIFTDTQYATTISRLVTFSFGRSMLPPHDPVGQKILSAVMVSAPLILLAQLLVYLMAVPLGIFCAVKRGKWQDKFISLGLFLLYSIPSFVAALLFLSFLCYGNFLKLFPTIGLHSDNYEQLSWFPYLLDYLWHIFLPVLCMSIFGLAGLAMYSRTSMLDVINQDYIRTARAKGLPEYRVILKHALRNALIPVITLFSNFLPALLGGSVLIETLFNIPGMGRLSFESINAKDYNTLMAMIYVDAIVVLISILISDILYVIVDPRISFEKQGARA